MGDACGGEGELEFVFDVVVPTHRHLVPVVAIDRDLVRNAIFTLRLLFRSPGHDDSSSSESLTPGRKPASCSANSMPARYLNGSVLTSTLPSAKGIDCSGRMTK